MHRISKLIPYKCYLFLQGVDDGDIVLGEVAAANSEWVNKPLGRLEATRIAIGRKVIRAEPDFDTRKPQQCVMNVCFASEDPFVKFTVEDEGKVYQLPVYLKDNELKEVKYHISDDGMPVIAFRITPTADNGLDLFDTFYNQEESDEANDNGGHYIVVESHETDFRVRILVKPLFYT